MHILAEKPITSLSNKITESNCAKLTYDKIFNHCLVKIAVPVADYLDDNGCVST